MEISRKYSHFPEHLDFQDFPQTFFFVVCVRCTRFFVVFLKNTQFRKGLPTEIDVLDKVLHVYSEIITKFYVFYLIIGQLNGFTMKFV